MPHAKTRAERRVETITAIKHCALAQLAASGPDGLSLRHVAREMGMVSSGIYRYYPSRDALLTDLIIDGYRGVAASLRTAEGDQGPDALADRARQLRTWALAQPHHFLLVFGTPVAGYEAPVATSEAAREMYAAFLSPINRPAKAQAPRAGSTHTPTDALSDQAQVVLESLGLDAHPDTVVRGAGFLAQATGLVMLELNGQVRGTFDPADHLFEDLVQRAAADILA